MRIVIDIPESKVPKQQKIIEMPIHFIDGDVCEAGGYGFVVLPKGHGNLIDADVLMEYCQNDINKTVDCNDIARFPTIIEADNEESEVEKK